MHSVVLTPNQNITMSNWKTVWNILVQVTMQMIKKNAAKSSLGHMIKIRFGAKRSAGHGWVHYDEQFRLRKALNPSSS